MVNQIIILVRKESMEIKQTIKSTTSLETKIIEDHLQVGNHAIESRNNRHRRHDYSKSNYNDDVFDETPSAESKLLDDLNSGANCYRERYWNSSQEKQLESAIEVKPEPVSNTSSITTSDDITVEFSKLSL
mgnify:CR=1 FL=1